MSRPAYVLDHLRNTFWFTPAVMTVSATVLSVLTLTLDDLVGKTDLDGVPVLRSILYSGSSDGARVVLGTIAGSMITVAGTVFSITIVALTLASNQFGPRLLNNFMRDRGNQVTLGTFVSTFLYSLLILRTIRSDDSSSVPEISVTVALLLAVGGLAVLIYFIHHVSMTIQAPNLVATISRELQRGVDRVFPDPQHVAEAEPTSPVALPPDEPGRCCAGASGYVQLVDTDHLVALARERDLLVRLLVRPGRFVVDSTVVAEVWPASAVTDDLRDVVAGTLTLGGRRTAIQDVEFPVRQLSEVAVRSLSSGINDPFTAETCIHQLSVGLCDVAGRELPTRTLADSDGVARVQAEDGPSFEDLVRGAYDQVRQCADLHVPVYVHLLDSLARIAGCVCDPDRFEPLVAMGRQVDAAADRSVPDPADRHAVAEALERLLAAVGDRRAELSGPARAGGRGASTEASG